MDIDHRLLQGSRPKGCDFESYSVTEAIFQDDFSVSIPLSQCPLRISSLIERKAPADSNDQLAGVGEVAELYQVGLLAPNEHHWIIRKPARRLNTLWSACCLSPASSTARRVPRSPEQHQHHRARVCRIRCPWQHVYQTTRVLTGLSKVGTSVRHVNVCRKCRR